MLRNTKFVVAVWQNWTNRYYTFFQNYTSSYLQSYLCLRQSLVLSMVIIYGNVIVLSRQKLTPKDITPIC